MSVGGGRFDFDDGGTYCGGWEDGKAHGHGVCTGPKGQGEYSGAWQYGYEISGVYTWPSGNQFEGQWLQGKRHGLGVESKGRWVYRGEWTQGFKGRYGTRTSINSGAKYEGTWTTGMQDGYGVESYADGGTYQGQWLRGTRHGYGVRQSVPYGLASHYRPKAMRTSLTSLRSEQEADHVVKERDKKLDESRGGFVLKARSDEEPNVRRLSLFDKHGRNSIKKSIMSGLKLKKQKSTGDINDSPRRPTGSVRSTISNISHMSMDSTQSRATNLSRYTDSNLSFISQDDITDVNVTETYMGEWKNDKRSGFGISERSDGLKYEGEWYNNKKYGYGVTSFKDGAKEEGKYKNNILISSGKKNKLFLIRSSKLRERIDNAVANAQRAAQIAIQKADIAISRMANARAKAEQAEQFALIARQDSDLARLKAKEFAPEFHQPGTDILKKRMEHGHTEPYADVLHMSNHHHHNPAHQRSKSMMANHSGEHGDTVNRPGMVHALSTAMDCALAGSSSKIVQGLNKLEPENTDHYLRASDDHYGGSMERIDRSPATTPNFHRRHNSGGHLYGEKPENLSDILNSTLINDHFDQYRTHRGDSGLGRDMYPEERYNNHTQQPPHMDPSPDSGVSDTESYRPGLMTRRKTLPSIVQGRGGGVAKESPTKLNQDKVQTPVRSSENLSKKNPDTFIIENGIRKRVHAEVHGAATKPSAKSGLPNRFRIEKDPASAKSIGAKRGSLPDVSECKELQKNLVSQREMHKLSSRRRDEIMKERREEERRRQGDIVIRLTDLKDWCQERQLLMFVIAVNVSLATMFFNLLSQQ
ncbi:LOW QUALITY PROTEIN: junctophilin-1-like [Tubulanus polymorphus]|uniref:LOW QUALITY PROTEIN: junctophilin-1-like n=1 Tax=Tubulanus polymorphus TaxID=672921 RepID=UPI003DA2B5F5